MRIRWTAFLLNTLALGSCAAVVIPIIVLVGMLSPWRDGIEELRKQHPGQTYVPIGVQAGTDGREEFRETTYLVLPLNVTAVIRKESNAITYEESPGGLYSGLICFILLFLLFAFFGIPRLRAMWRGTIHPLTGRRKT